MPRDPEALAADFADLPAALQEMVAAGWDWLRDVPAVCVSVDDPHFHYCTVSVTGVNFTGVKYGETPPTVGRIYAFTRTRSGRRWIKVLGGAIRAAWWHLRDRTPSLAIRNGGSIPSSHWEAGVGGSAMVAETDVVGGVDVFTTLTQDGADIRSAYVGPPADSGPSGTTEYFAHLCPSATPGVYYLVSLRYDTDPGSGNFQMVECNLWRNNGAGATFTKLHAIPLPSLGLEFCEFRVATGDPKEPDTVYVGSVEQTNPGGTTFASAVIKTTDAGAHWTRLANPFTMTANAEKIQQIGPMGDGNLIVLDYGNNANTNGFGYSTSDDDGATWTHAAESTTAAPPALDPAYAWTRGDWHDGQSDAIFPVPLADQFESVEAVGHVAYDHFYDFYYAPGPTVDVPDPAALAEIGPNWADQRKRDPGDLLIPSPLSGNTNNFNPTGMATAYRIDLSSSATVDLTGMATGVDGRIVLLRNTGGFDIHLTFMDGASSAGNRFYFLTGLGNPPKVLHPGALITCQYDASAFGEGAWNAEADPGSYDYNGGLWYMDPAAGLKVP